MEIEDTSEASSVSRLEDIRKLARTFHLQDGTPMDPVTLATKRGLLDATFAPLDERTLEEYLDDWSGRVADSFEEHNTPPHIQTILRNGASRFFHAVNVENEMDIKLHGKQSAGWKPLTNAVAIDNSIEHNPSIERDNEAIIDLNEFVTSLASKLLLQELQNSDIKSDDVTIARLIGLTVSNVLDTYEEKMEKRAIIRPPKQDSPSTLIEQITHHPERVAKNILPAYFKGL